MCPLLFQVYFYLNLSKAQIEVTMIENDDFFSEQIVSSDNAIKSIMKNELQLFFQLCVWSFETKNPLA